MVISEIFGSKVFSDKVMRQRLPKGVYESLRKTRKEGLPLDANLAEFVAAAMKDWAIEQGATHYTHWFQPMSNSTAGKHDSFLEAAADGEVMLAFSGKALVQGEPDASSFPSGGLRATFEARGYTAWDPTSPAFVRDGTLYIPTAFCSYTGEALDIKTPLLRSMQAVSREALRVLRTFGNTTSRQVTATVGAEQEYFLVDRQLYEQRLDLKICGRTLFGAKPPKGQELEDHYCGRIRLRVAEYMRRLDEELWSLGITSKTKHNEAAPAQHEMAPIFESANIACDHNQLTMEMMRIIAKKQGLACLLHEKPFQYVNGSGKHNNWGLQTDDGINLFKLSKNQDIWENLQFLIFLCAVIRAVYRHGDLLRLSAASASNDHRLGGYEAPPAIISVFLGDQLTDVLRRFQTGEGPSGKATQILETGVATLPTLPKDGSDRNRTSPFAFTGNKFEFRMVGSSQSVGTSTTFINTAVAESLAEIADRLERCADFDGEAHAIIAETVEKYGAIIYNGNNYSQEWVEEAKRRGLPNLTNTVDAIHCLLEPKNIELFERFGVLSPTEVHARYEVLLESYAKSVGIEAATMLDMAKRQILPAALRYAGEAAGSYNQIAAAGIQSPEVLEHLTRLTDGVGEARQAAQLLESRLAGQPEGDPAAEAAYMRDHILPAMTALRECCDLLETMVDARLWPFPTYTALQNS